MNRSIATSRFRRHEVLVHVDHAALPKDRRLSDAELKVIENQGQAQSLFVHSVLRDAGVRPGSPSVCTHTEGNTITVPVAVAEKSVPALMSLLEAELAGYRMRASVLGR